MSTDALIDLITALWLGSVGACVGSFLNVVAYRVPLGMSVIWRPSHCPSCDRPIRARDNVPVLGWLILKGKCRDCGAPISPRYAIVEAIMGTVFFVLAYLEVFTAGRYLPGGPISDVSGAMDTVWNPQWPVLGIYAFHCVLASIFMALSLMRLDGNLSRIKFAVTTFVLLLAWFGVPLLFVSK